MPSVMGEYYGDMMKLNSKFFILMIFAAIAFMIAGFLFCKMVDTASVFPFLDYLFAPITTLFAAFGGAWYAFKLQDVKTKKDANERDVKAANNVIFELTRWHKKFHAFRRQFIVEHIDDPWRHILIMPVTGMSPDHPKFDYDSLAFIFKSKNPNLLGTLSLAELEISSTIDVILQRSKMHVEILQPAAEAVEKRFEGTFPPDEIEKQLGARNSQVLRMLTDYVVSGVTGSLATIRKHIDLIQAETKAIYPDHVVIGMTDPPTVTEAKAQ